MNKDVLLVGLGKVGMMYDLDSPSFKTHASSIIKTKSLNLIGAVDKSKIKRNFFAKKFNKPVFSSFLQAVKSLKPSILVISVDTLNTEKIYKHIINNKLSFDIIIFEKPVSNNLQIAKKIFDYCKKKKIIVLVNYLRRFDKSTFNLKKILNSKKIGTIKEIKVIYKKGFINSCSHYINYLDYFFNLNKKIKIIKTSNFTNHDFHVNFLINHNYEIIFEYSKNKLIDEKILIIGKFGIVEYLTEKGLIKVIKNNKKEILKNNYDKPFKSVYNNVCEVISSKSFPKSTIKDSLKTIEIMNLVLKKIRNKV